MINYFITGITGQDGIFLTKKLLEKNKNLHIYGSTRQIKIRIFITSYQVFVVLMNSRITLINIDLCDSNTVHELSNDIKPAQIYNLSGPSSVYESYKRPIKQDMK